MKITSRSFTPRRDAAACGASPAEPPSRGAPQLRAQIIQNLSFLKAPSGIDFHERAPDAMDPDSLHAMSREVRPPLGACSSPRAHRFWPAPVDPASCVAGCLAPPTAKHSCPYVISPYALQCRKHSTVAGTHLAACVMRGMCGAGGNSGREGTGRWSGMPAAPAMSTATRMGTGRAAAPPQARHLPLLGPILARTPLQVRRRALC